MYVPKHFSEAEDQKIRILVTENSFVTVLSYPKDELPYINHLPVVYSQDPSEKDVLIGHMAKRNPQWLHFQTDSRATIIVGGPHTYITPTWYQSGRDVPTWNYAVAHLQGRIELISDFMGQIEILKQLTEFYEGNKPGAWEFELPEDLLDSDSLTSAIISFKFRIEKKVAKFKLSQNRPEVDRQGVIAGLKQRNDENSKAILKMMEDFEKNQSK